MLIHCACDAMFEDTNDECCGDHVNKTVDNKLNCPSLLNIYLTV